MQQQSGSSGNGQSNKSARSNAARKDATRRNIEAKVIVLEEIADRIRPLMEGVPSSMAKFREWVDPALGLERIGSSTTTDPNLAEHNGILIARAYTAMQRVNSLRTKLKLRVYVPVGRRVDKLEEEKKQLEVENRRLASEVLMFKHRCDVFSDELRQAKGARDLAESQLNAMRADYVQAINAKPRRVK